MTKQTNPLTLLNKIIDDHILSGQDKTNSRQYKQLTKLHKIIIKELNIIK